jgi:hypothetical protein
VVIKIGLLLDSWRVPVWQKLVIEYIKSNPSLSIELVVLNESHGQSASGSFVNKLFRKIDRYVFSVKQDCFQRVDIRELLKDVKNISVKPTQTRFTDTIPDHDLVKIKNEKLDILIRFGFRILTGDIFYAALNGVWSLHHGDCAVNRGGPPAFWEIVNREAVTGVTLQVLSDDLDGGVVIDQAFVRTDRTSFNRNQNAQYWAGIELFCNALFRVSNRHAAHPPAFPVNTSSMGGSAKREAGFYSKPLYRNPNNLQALSIFISFWIRRLGEMVKSVFKKQQWSLHYKVKQGSIETSLFRYKKLTPPAGTDWADPFVVFKENKYYLFFEELVCATKKAHISYLEFDNSGNLISKAPVVALKEQHHLSYPFIFEHSGDYYMIPEAAESKSVWLYKCEKFPHEWKKHKLLLEETALFDPTIVFQNNMWYLFGTQKPLNGSSTDQYLYLYFSENLFSGSWKRHPLNPITRDVRGARPAGKIFEYNGKLIRPSQLGAPKYGYGLRFQGIVTLSPEVYEEKPLSDILPEWKEGLLATHTFNSVNGFSVVDSQM